MPRPILTAGLAAALAACAGAPGEPPEEACGPATACPAGACYRGWCVEANATLIAPKPSNCAAGSLSLAVRGTMKPFAIPYALDYAIDGVPRGRLHPTLPNLSLAPQSLDGSASFACDDLAHGTHTLEAVLALDDEDVAAGPAVTFVVDRVPPVLVSVSPAPGTALPSASRVTITFTFDEPVGLHATCSVDALPPVTCAAATGSEVRASVSLYPSAESLHVRLESVKDLAGNPLAAPVELDWTVAP